jgi:hypothetical protein
LRRRLYWLALWQERESGSRQRRLRCGMYL